MNFIQHIFQLSKMTRLKWVSLLLLIVLTGNFSFLFAQNINLKKVHPPSWWYNMENKSFQLMVYGNNIALCNVLIECNAIKIDNIAKVENPNYLFIDLSIINEKKVQEFNIEFFHEDKKVAAYNYKLDKKSDIKRGFSSADVIYLLMPDRFANGNKDNDNVNGYSEKADRNNPDGRHGGDLHGIISNLDYIKNTGFTALWLNPIFENNMPQYSYHGYSITDYYLCDARLGNNLDYLALSKEAHRKGLKLIMDIVLNHCGNQHWWISDLPEASWLNSDKDLKTSYRASTLLDPHSSDFDKNKFLNGWFVPTMPDLNHKNKLLSKYLIQNIIWWIEYAGIDGIRIDTQPYSDKDFVSMFNQELLKEFPDLTILGESWFQEEAFTAYFLGNSPIAKPYNSYTHSVTDFPLYYALKNAFNEDEGWDTGLARIYNVLAQDFVYGSAHNNVIFIDNHDLDRYYSSIGEDIRKLKMAIAFLLTTRGIPVFYYGDETIMNGLEHTGHGNIRKDFPGGWDSDSINYFTFERIDRTKQETYQYIKKLLIWRQSNEAAKYGKLIHFVPQENVYVYFRIAKSSAIMVILNNDNNKSMKIGTKHYQEILKDYKIGIDIIKNEELALDSIEIEAKSIKIIELQ